MMHWIICFRCWNLSLQFCSVTYSFSELHTYNKGLFWRMKVHVGLTYSLWQKFHCGTHIAMLQILFLHKSCFKTSFKWTKKMKKTEMMVFYVSGHEIWCMWIVHSIIYFRLNLPFYYLQEVSLYIFKDSFMETEVWCIVIFYGKVIVRSYPYLTLEH
jgi:hypothetical protein